jgi:FKBP-type peptidyl-prolyl cis-trans isomerase FklB
LGDFSWETMGVASNSTVGAFMQGFATALLNMHIGDRWRVHIPYALMYGAASTSSYPSYSNMIFDVALVDYWSAGETRPTFRARQR